MAAKAKAAAKPMMAMKAPLTEGKMRANRAAAVVAAKAVLKAAEKSLAAAEEAARTTPHDTVQKTTKKAKTMALKSIQDSVHESLEYIESLEAWVDDMPAHGVTSVECLDVLTNVRGELARVSASALVLAAP